MPARRKRSGARSLLTRRARIASSSTPAAGAAAARTFLPEYERWYADLVSRIDARRAEIVAIGGEEGFATVRESYTSLLDAVRRGDLGGAIVRARASA